MTAGVLMSAAYRVPSRIPVMSRSSGRTSSSHGASSSGCRLAGAFSAVSIEAVGCQNARSGVSPVATLVWTPCSYGSGMVTTSTSAPVASSNADTTASGTVTELWAAQIVRSTPDRSAVWSGQATGSADPASPPPPALGSEQAVASSATAPLTTARSSTTAPTGV